MNRASVCGPNQTTTFNELSTILRNTNPRAIGFATAFLSKEGAYDLVRLTNICDCEDVRVIAGTSGFITHPDALKLLADSGVAVRLGVSEYGIFHPKLVVGGHSFSRRDQIVRPICGYVGSANLTYKGLRKNVEIGLATSDILIVEQLAASFSELWSDAELYSTESATTYGQDFARAQRIRSVQDIELLEIGSLPANQRRRERPSSLLTDNATVAWAGLKSFTGEHTFQVEFPGLSGVALSNILNPRTDRVQVMCSDWRQRDMVFKYYDANGMYRLNVPNDVPLVDWARVNRAGILCVKAEMLDGASIIRADILRNETSEDVILRSKVLNAWGKTSTREYGWY